MFQIIKKIAAVCAAVLFMALSGAISRAKNFDPGPKPPASRQERARVDRRFAARQKNKATAANIVSHPTRKTVRRPCAPSFRGPLRREGASAWVWGGTMGILLIMQMALLGWQIAVMRKGNP